MEIIKLKSRYGAVHSLIPIDEKHYRFKSAEDWMPISLHGYENDYMMMDPDGGPCLSVGDTLDSKIIKAIYMLDGYLTVEFV